MLKKRYKGLIAASFTPFDKNGGLALKKIPGLVDFSINNDLNGLFICGSTGEFASMTTEERMMTAEAYINAADGRIPIIVHVGSCSINESKQLARHAAKHGAVAVAALAPFYFKTNNAKLLLDVLSEIAGSAPHLPFYYYHMPSATGATIAMIDFLPLAEKAIPNFAGVKFTNEDLMDYQRSVEYSGDRMQIMFGRDEILLGAFALGAEAAVGSTFNYAAWIYQGVISAFEKNNIKEAKQWQSLSQKLVAILQKFGSGAQKALMQVAGADVGYSRLPVPNLGKKEFKELEKMANEIFNLRSH